MKRVHPKTLMVYESARGNQPFTQWLFHLKDSRMQAIITDRLNRLASGNMGECEPIGEGLSELKIRFGPGYRIYFGQEGETIVILLCGGTKRTQATDIRLAKSYWNDYRRQSNET